MERVVVIGNSASGKSMLARQLAVKRDLPYIEVDTILWRPGWRRVDDAAYRSEHSRLISQERWIIDGLGMRDSIAGRLARATDVVLIDMPLRTHFWFAAKRQMGWAMGRLRHPPARIAEAPPTLGLFKSIWDVERDWMPEVRSLVAYEEHLGKRVFRLRSVEELDGLLAREDVGGP